MRILKISLEPQRRLLNCGIRSKLLLMDTNDIKLTMGYTDRQVEYLLDQIDVLKRSKARGKAREFTHRDLALFKTIASLRETGVSIRDINELLNRIEDNPGRRATIAVYPVKNRKPIVRLELNTTVKSFNEQLNSDAELLLLLDGEWLYPDHKDMPVFFVSEFLTNEDQLELELEEEAVQND